MSRGTLEVRGAWGPFKKVTITGGPWMDKPEGAFGICMAPEVLAKPHRAVPEPDVMVHVADFSTPNSEEVRKAACLALLTALQGKQVYVGCGFGIGRTGTLLGLIARIADPRLRDPVTFVRANYYEGAIETIAQREMVEGLDVRRAQKAYQRWLWSVRLRPGYVLSLTRDAWRGRPYIHP